MNKKAVELTMNTIIIAIIVLLVLVLLAYFLINSSKTFSEGKQCSEAQGTCMQTQACTGIMSEVSGSSGYCPTGTICCRVGG